MRLPWDSLILAMVDNEYTVKYLEQDRNGFYLRPGNLGYPNIHLNNHLEIHAVAAGVFRK